MSELKEHIFCDIDEVFPRGYCGPLPSHEARPYYLKSEADEVIAEKDAEIAYLKDIDSKNRSAYYKDLAMMAKDVEHHKYKRCLAMAKICEDKLGTVVKPGWWNKWRKRWLELAEKFKDKEAK